MDTIVDGQIAPPAFSTPGNIQRYKHENTLFMALAIVSVTLLVLLTIGTLGLIWVYLLLGYVVYLMVASYLISYVRGNGVQISAEQFPGLHNQLLRCCKIAGIAKPPEFYLVAGDGVRNAFATRFLNRYYVVMLSDIVDALDDDEEALAFYIGHELGHIAQSHVKRMWWIRLAMFIPLLGTAYSRAREYTCDQYGLACCPGSKSAVNALTVLAAGSRRWKTLHQRAYIGQSRITGGFWMSLNELTADYPWLCKRAARLQHGDATDFPRRHIAAWLIAGLIPRTGLGLMGGLLIVIYMAVVVAVVLSASGGLGSFGVLKNMQSRISSASGIATPEAELSDAELADTEAAAPAGEEASAADIAAVAQAHKAAMSLADLTETYIKKRHEWPGSAAKVGYALPANSPVASLDMEQERTISVKFKAPHEAYSLTLIRMSELDSEQDWYCHAQSIPAAALPEGCAD